MTNCKHCGGRGWEELWHGGSSSWTPSLKQCYRKCNLKGYSDEVQRRLNNPNHITQTSVLQAAPSEKPKNNVIRLYFHNANQES
jgi:hypothetical protein